MSECTPEWPNLTGPDGVGSANHSSAQPPSIIIVINWRINLIIIQGTRLNYLLGHSLRSCSRWRATMCISDRGQPAGMANMCSSPGRDNQWDCHRIACRDRLGQLGTSVKLFWITNRAPGWVSIWWRWEVYPSGILSIFCLWKNNAINKFYTFS